MLHNGVDNLSGLRDLIIGGQPYTITGEVSPRSIRTRTYIRQKESITSRPPKKNILQIYGEL